MDGHTLAPGWLRLRNHVRKSGKLVHAMKYFFEHYLPSITRAFPVVKGSESACGGLSVVAEKRKAMGYDVRYLAKFAAPESNDLHLVQRA